MSGSRWEIRSQVVMAVTAVIGVVISLVSIGAFHILRGDGGGDSRRSAAIILPQL